MAKQPTPHLELVSITPERAVNWLQHNNKNRPLNERHARKLASIMDAGHWVQNGDTIAFDGSGRLIDGQHRLRAICIHGHPVKAVVVRNLPDNAFQTKDCGKRRSTSDAFKIAGVAGYAGAAAASTLILRWAVTRRTYGSWAGCVESLGVTNQNHLDFVDDNELFTAAMRLAQRAQNECRGIIPLSMLATWYYAFSLARQDYGRDVQQYWYDFAVGVNLRVGMGAYRLRKTLVDQLRSQHTLTRDTVFWLGIQAGVADLIKEKNVTNLRLPKIAPPIGTRREDRSVKKEVIRQFGIDPGAVDYYYERK